MFEALALWLSLTMTATLATSSNTIAKPGCEARCGNITIPYPFGIGRSQDGRACSLNELYNITCDKSFNPPKALLKNNNTIEVLDISVHGQILTKSIVAAASYGQGGEVITSIHADTADTDLSHYPLVFSDKDNRLVVIGCDDYAFLDNVVAAKGAGFRSGCIVGCKNVPSMINGSCSGIGCCQTSIPNKLYFFTLQLGSLENHTQVIKENPYGYAFVGDPSKFKFNVDDLSDPDFMTRTRDSVPVVLDWFIRYDVDGTQTCETHRRNGSTYTCHNNSRCYDYHDTGGGYTCVCLPGYEGNPYLSPGCTDIDECVDFSSSGCSKVCINIPGSYKCSCPKGYHGDGRKNGSGCVNSYRKIIIGVCAILGSLLLPPIGWWLYRVNKKREILKQKAINFQKNGGLLLQRRMSSDEHIAERTHFFTIEELENATDHFNESRILGRGGQGTVYKGMLGEGKLVAIKKSKTLNESQKEDFINEVVIMSQIIHRSIVKLLGCCFESEVPILVYECIPNGTLSNHLHHVNEEFPITWRMRLQIASDLAGALAYLHSFLHVPILHRDIKSSKILQKLSDFGLSKNVAPDHTHVTTRVIGTFGYLDPEYFQTNQYTEKSDVYSFGVVLVELLTGQKAVRTICDQDRSLVSWFLSHMENSQLHDIVDPQVLKESSKEEVYTIADLATQCLNPKGKRRPTMKEVLLVLETEESDRVKLPQTDEVQNSSKLEQVLAARTTNSSYHENVATSSTSSMDTPYCQSAELSLLYNPR